MLVTHLRCKLSQSQKASGRKFQRWKLHEKAITAEHAWIVGMRVLEHPALGGIELLRHKSCVGVACLIGVRAKQAQAEVGGEPR